MSSDDLDANVDFRMLSDALDAADESFFLNAISEEATQAPPPDHEDSLESRDISSTESATNPDTKAHAEPSNAVIEPRKTADGPQDENDPPQAMLIFVMGDHRVSDSCALGVLNEHPEALKAITSNQCLRTSAFLKPALEAAMAELRPSMMMPVAVRLTAISLRLVAGILPNHQTSPQDDNVDEGEQQKLAEIVQHELGQAVPYYQWQGPTNYCGRIQHLMALLEEAIRIMAVPSDLLTAALKLDAAAAHISQQVLRSILDLGQKPEDVCGTWAADTLLSAWILRKARRPPQCLAPDSSRVKENGINLAVSSDSESEEELPSPSKFVQRRPDAKAGRALSPEDKVRAADDQNVKSGSAEEPLYISDSDLEDQPSPELHTRSSDLKASRHSCRGEARKEVDYNIKRHPQDKDLPTVRKRRRLTQRERGNLGFQARPGKCYKASDDEIARAHS